MESKLNPSVLTAMSLRWDSGYFVSTWRFLATTVIGTGIASLALRVASQ